ncbi:MAG: NAD-dependent malic enzyme [Gammaproteobacteria bacterium]|nr:NADP-dependent malic enzyme [Gammaproteobacteria bacterium]MDE2023613.1 NAD-dependent malic enzyme [Gammaproteobacteria bacterium]MDE2139979.1 NAD-dependent malic enzyme [Gammaproteobacteria bacterium]
MQIPEILVIESQHRPGNLGRILTAIGECGIMVDHITLMRRAQDKSVWEITVEMDEAARQQLNARLADLPYGKLLGRSDRVFNRHRGGKIETVSKVPLDSIQQLRDVYTPGVARVCLEIQKHPEEVWDYTNIGNTVGIITNGTAILGLGHIGAIPGLPVMEGKAMIYAKFVGISGVPILLNDTEPRKVIDAVLAIESSFGAIHLEDIAAPACFEVEETLAANLAKPVMQDDQHGTAVVTLGALLTATRRVQRELQDSVIGQIGLGAAGIGIAQLLLRFGVKQLFGTDLRAEALARLERLGGKRATLSEVMQKADIVIATSGVKGLIKPELVRKGQLIFALSNPEAEIEPRLALEHGAVFATDGRSVNNALGFPALFRGALDARAKRFTHEMYLAAAQKLAELAPPDELLPHVLDKSVHLQVAEAVKAAATKS